MRRLIRIAALLTMSLAAAILAPGIAHAAPGETTLCHSTDYSCIAGTGYTGQSVWGSWGPGHNCVSYAAFRLAQNGAARPWGGAIGNANQWDEKARSVGIAVDTKPTVGSIAQWDTGSAGHIAYVEVVTPSYIQVSEDSFLSNTSGSSSIRRLDRSGSIYAGAEFIHIRDARDEFFIKTKNTGSGRVEIHTATASSGYQGSDLHTTTWFGTGDQDNGWFQMVGRDLFFIKTKNTGNGHIEIHTATVSSGYQNADLHAATWLSTGDEGNGWFQMFAAKA